MACACEFSLDASAPGLSGAVVAIGVFDGVHLGHRALIESAVGEAREKGAASAVLTFDVDPDDLFGGERFVKIMSNERRVERLAEEPVDAVFVMRFTPEVAALAPDEFLERVFGAALPLSIHVGRDFRFGKGASGDVGTLEEWARRRGVGVCVLDLVSVGEESVKSTRIRGLLSEGDVAGARLLLGRPYTIAGTVEHGRGEGADMGFATANLLVPPRERVLADGVYGAYATVSGERYKAAVSVGVSPTFEDASRANVEVHILDFEGDLYGSEVVVEFVERLRPMMRFSDVDELVSTVKGDIERVRRDL